MQSGRSHVGHAWDSRFSEYLLLPRFLGLRIIQISEEIRQDDNVHSFHTRVVVMEFVCNAMELP